MHTKYPSHHKYLNSQTIINLKTFHRINILNKIQAQADIISKEFSAFLTETRVVNISERDKV